MGYLVGMNRGRADLALVHASAERFPIEGGYAVYPRENSGGPGSPRTRLGSLWRCSTGTRLRRLLPNRKVVVR